jgi:hypothetical protein
MKSFLRFFGAVALGCLGQCAHAADNAPKAVNARPDGTVTSHTKITPPASSTGTAGFRLPHGVAPTSPVNGDVWTTTAGMYVRVNSSTVGPLGTGGGGGGSGDLLSTNNLSDVSDASVARTNLGLAIGANVQAYDADLTSYAGVTPAANTLSLLGAANYAAMRTQLGLTIGTDVQAFDADLSALAALSGTNTIYYRSASNTWTAVTVSTGLDFTAGVLTATGGGGGGLVAADINTSAKIAAIVADETGTNLLVYNTSPTLVTPILGTPTSVTLTNATGLPVASGISGLGTGVATFLATPSGANLATALTTALPASKGGTGLTALAANVVTLLGAADYSAMRTQLSLVPGTDVQAYDADLLSWASVTRASGFDTFTATPSSANFASLLTNETGTGVAVLNSDPLILRPASAMAASAVDITKVNGTKTLSASATWTLSATPVDGQKFGLIITNSHTAPIVITLDTWGTVYSMPRSANITTITVPVGEFCLDFEKVGSVIKLHSDPTTIADLAAIATPTRSDLLAGNDVSALADGSMTIAQVLELAVQADVTGLKTSDSPQFTAVNVGAASDTTLARAAAGQLSVEGVNLVTVSSTDTLTNKTLDAAGTGNIVKFKSYIYLTNPHLADGTGATIGTTATGISYGHATFSNSADEAANYVEYYIQVPEDIDTSVALRARVKVLLGNTDTGTHRYVISSVSVADSAVPTSSTLANAINIDFAGDGSGANGDVETSAWTTLTSWAGALTAGQTWRIRLARDGNATEDASTVNSTELGLVIEYGVTQ